MMYFTLISSVLVTAAAYQTIKRLLISPLRNIPGPKLYALTKWRLALDEWQGKRTRTIHQLHQLYGPVIRIGPNEVHFNSLTAMRLIYGPGAAFELTEFYRLFEAYGKQNLFSFASSRQHADRRRLLAHAYSKTSVLKNPFGEVVEGKVRQYLRYVDGQDSKGIELFTSLHYFALDTVSHVLYGARFGSTSAMAGDDSDRALLGDIFDPSRRKLIWFRLHLELLTEWMYTQTGILEKLIRPFLPMKKPVTYSGVRQHALQSWKDFSLAASTMEDTTEDGAIISVMFRYHISQKDGYLQDLEIASECADHLLGGVDTTANTLMFLLWALSLPVNRKYQMKLIEEVTKLPGEVFHDGVPPVALADKMVYVNAVIKEALRIYTPNPATQPRSSPLNSTIDDYVIPARTVVGMSAYSLHRNEQVFEEPLKFDPDRWLSPKPTVVEMNKWFWAFSSGARTCTGKNLVMTEMTTLVAAIYREYSTSIVPGFEDSTPVVTSRFELFHDETMSCMEKVGMMPKP
ncbi:hypothetical protein HYALB_00000647 [Hymenoscyphus albidus]|uniref:P450 monooxygenase n=1 Tax=Hymenoscyphus albidus TaxID=595503 RepID=A0A9N9M103_9HELO|nr:hypothetical protein HYALB_00000647 [Hymenoscyphus albidus]